MARFLLLCQDRVGSEELGPTHDFLSELIGARRPTVRQLSPCSAGAIRYWRGTVEIRDRSRLLEMSCEWYRVSVTEYERLFGPAPRLQGIIMRVLASADARVGADCDARVHARLRPGRRRP